MAARTSAFRFKGRNPDMADIGRQLKVAYLLEGSVRKEGKRLRITAQLIVSKRRQPSPRNASIRSGG